MCNEPSCVAPSEEPNPSGHKKGRKRLRVILETVGGQRSKEWKGDRLRAQPLGRGVRKVEPQTQRAVVGLFEILVLKSDNGQPSAQSWSPAFFEARGSRTCASHILGTISRHKLAPGAEGRKWPRETTRDLSRSPECGRQMFRAPAVEPRPGTLPTRV
jgi:hypothetical protein